MRMLAFSLPHHIFLPYWIEVQQGSFALRRTLMCMGCFYFTCAGCGSSATCEDGLVGRAQDHREDSEVRAPTADHWGPGEGGRCGTHIEFPQPRVARGPSRPEVSPLWHGPLLSPGRRSWLPAVGAVVHVGRATTESAVSIFTSCPHSL